MADTTQIYDPTGTSVQLSPGTPAYTPDYNSLIQNDSGYQMAQADAQANVGNAGAARTAAVRQAVLRYGGVLPQGFTDRYGDIDQATLDAAKNNQFSTLANLARNRDTSEMNLRKGLAARGALQSGDLNYGEDQLNTQYGQSQYDAANNFGDQYTGAIGQYMQSVAQAQRDQVNAYFAAEQNIMNNPAYAPTPGTPAVNANYDQSWSIVAGQPVYSDANGNLYDASGKPIDPLNPGPYSGPALGIPTGGGNYVPYVPGSGPAPAPAPTPATPQPVTPSIYSGGGGGGKVTYA